MVAHIKKFVTHKNTIKSLAQNIKTSRHETTTRGWQRTNTIQVPAYATTNRCCQHGDINLEQHTAILRAGTLTNHHIRPSSTAGCMVSILYKSQHRIEHKIGLKRPSRPSVIELFRGHVWEKSPAHKPCSLTHIYCSVIPPRSMATDAESNVWSLLNLLSLSAHSGWRTFCFPHFQATIFARHPLS